MEGGGKKSGKASRESLLPAGGEKVPGRADEGQATSLFAKPSLDDMGPGTDMTRPARKPAAPDGSISPAATEGQSGFRKPTLEDIGHNIAVPARPEASLFRKNSLDERTVGRTEKPLNTTGKLPEKPKTEPGQRFSPLLEGQPEKRDASSASSDDPKPFIRANSGVGSYEDAGDLKRQKKTKGKTGRPGQ